jgi:hypothetical protein
MEVLYVEGVAIHDGPESCVGVREGAGEAWTGGVWAGLLSREIALVQGADAFEWGGRPCRRRRYREPLVDPARSENPGTHVDPYAREPVVNTNAGGGSMVDGGSADCGAVEVMEVVWPSEVALRGEASNRPHLHWLKTVVENVVGKGAAVIASGAGREDERWARALCRRRVETRELASKPRPPVCLGMSLGGTRLLPRRRPAYRQHEPDRGASTERVKASPDTAAGAPAATGRAPSGRIREEQSTVAGHAGGLARSSCEASAYRSGGGAKGRGRPGKWMRSTAREEARA